MLLSTLANIEMLLKNRTELNDLTIASYISLLKHYTVGKWIYPGVIKRKLNISIKQVYESLYLIEKEGIIDSYYELYCSFCQKSSGITVKTFNEIPDSFECEICSNKISGIDNALLIYKVIKE